MKSLVRVSRQSRVPGSDLYKESVKQFFEKMSGISNVLEAMVQDGDSHFWDDFVSEDDPVVKGAIAVPEDAHKSL